MKNTLLSAMGFEDYDLKTPEHDQIMLWVDANAEAVALQAWKFLRLDQDSFGKHGVHRAGLRFVRVAKKTWEMPIYRDRRMIGFVDMALACEGCFQRDGYDQAVAIEIGVEVKSAIKSVGELIRQVRAYGLDHFVVVCPDDRFADVIRSQGIGFIKCPTFSASRSGELF